MATLYDLTDDFMNLLEQYDGSDTDIADSLAAIQEDIENKVANGIGLIQELKRRVESYDAEIKRLATLKKATENRISQIQSWYLYNLQSCGMKKIWTPRGTMSVVKNGGKPPLIIDDENLIPADFKFTRTVDFIDKDSLRDALANGEFIDGAHLEERGHYLKIS